MNTMITFRPAQDGDHEFCFLVTEYAMRSYVEQAFGHWDEERQRERHAHEFASRRPDIVSCSGVDVGIWLVLRKPTRLVLSKIYLLPEFQRRGIGSNLLDRLIRESERARLPIHLRLLKVNPVLSLYERKGFSVVRLEDPYVYMERPL
jgi:GNAT superfamily N-acetyltransferase